MICSRHLDSRYVPDVVKVDSLLEYSVSGTACELREQPSLPSYQPQGITKGNVLDERSTWKEDRRSFMRGQDDAFWVQPQPFHAGFVTLLITR